MDQRALAAFFAISDLFFLESFLARAFPPLRPPRRPRATAAGFFSAGSSVALRTMLAASVLTSAVGFLERLCMA